MQHTFQPSDQQPHQHLRLMLQKVPMRALGAIEEVFLLALFAFGGAGVGVGVGHFGGLAVLTDVDAVPARDYGGEGGGGEDVAARRKMRGISLGFWEDDRRG